MIDGQTRERLLNTLRCYFFDVADRVEEFGDVGSPLVNFVNHVASKAMAAIDEATTPQWVRVTPETMPPVDEWILMTWTATRGHVAVGRLVADGQWWTTSDLMPTCFPPTHWMPLPAPPSEAAEPPMSIR